MKIPVAIVVALVICCSMATGQVLDGDPEHVVRAVLDSKIPGVWSESVVDKQLSSMGDAACVALTKIIGGRKLTSVDVERALMVVHVAFRAPKIVQSEADREPRTALFVLNSLESATTDPNVVSRIRETRLYVEEQYRKAMQELQKSP